MASIMATDISATEKPPPAEQRTRDPDAPKRWDVKTSPLEVIFHYAKDGVSEEQIRLLLEEKNIPLANRPQETIAFDRRHYP
jgi:hypothetical protein